MRFVCQPTSNTLYASFWQPFWPERTQQCGLSTLEGSWRAARERRTMRGWTGRRQRLKIARQRLDKALSPPGRRLGKALGPVRVCSLLHNDPFGLGQDGIWKTRFRTARRRPECSRSATSANKGCRCKFHFDDQSCLPRARRRSRSF